MKPSAPPLWQRTLRKMTGLLARPRRGAGAPAAAPRDESDWAARSAVGEEDPGASVDLLDTLPPVPGGVKGDGPPRS
ncbi:MAG TPA: hypothetical protein VLG41_19890 [Hydrogenophaga sp.]|uniref:hypothetical protein n=1 Tax=Hydrogenophaga sp. TaxID=1904254 RepID=UPI002C57DCF5|nr:hypothetical protein [Hydrogenophaga sp.]HSX95196.1 hypothetical protein [Hydrogenophaga sp.]